MKTRRLDLIKPRTDNYRTIHEIPGYPETSERPEPEIPVSLATGTFGRRSARASRAGIVASGTRIASGNPRELRHSRSASIREHRAN